VSVSESASKPSVIVAGSEVLCVSLLAEYISCAEDVDRVLEVHSLTTAQEQWVGDPPDVIFVETDTCHSATPVPEPREWKVAFPDARIVAFAFSTDAMDTVRAIERGACGFVSKNAKPAVFLERIRQVMRGELAINPEYQSVLMARLQELSSASSDWQTVRGPLDTGADLTARELEILRLLAEGMTNRQIAYTLGVSESTVKNHLTNLFRKLEVDCRSQAINVGVRTGILRL
jgi:DNA-binding NarL/FixJ family response regulator